MTLKDVVTELIYNKTHVQEPNFFHSKPLASLFFFNTNKYPGYWIKGSYKLAINQINGGNDLEKQ